MKISIQKACLKDVSTIQNIALKTWPDTFENILSHEQIQYMLEWMYNPTSLSKQIADENFYFYLAFIDKIPCGFISAEVNYNHSQTTKVHKLYILPAYQGQGVGKKLVNKILSIATQNNNIKLTLNVNKNNPAKYFYEKIGFILVKEELIDIGNNFFMNDFVFEKLINRQ